MIQRADWDAESYFQTHLPIKQELKDKKGEVFTPPALIDQVLDLFPAAVWSNPDLKWLDPCAGVGFFMIRVFQRLMTGLSRTLVDTKQRQTHILGNMLHMVELSKANCKQCRRLFGDSAQVVCADYLSTHLEPMDCIVGNPPFQDYYGLNVTGRRITGGKNKLYERIFLHALNQLRPGGHLAMIVPINLFGGNGSQGYQKLLENHVSFVSVNPSIESFFDRIQQPMAYFLLTKDTHTNTHTNTNTNTDKSTVVEYAEDKQWQTVLKDRPVNPIRNWSPTMDKRIDQFVSRERTQAIRYNRGWPLDWPDSDVEYAPF